MMIQKGARKASTRGSKGRALPRLYSIAGLLKERSFSGTFEAGGSNFDFIYAPLKASAAGRKLILEGPLTVTDSRGSQRARERVQALLAAIQGGLGVAPTRPQIAGGASSRSQAAGSAPALSQTESTGPLSFTGAMYFQLEPLDGRALGVAADLSRLQLNARLAPTDSTARALHGAFSAIVDALYGEKVDEAAANAYIGELNRLLKG